MKIKKCIVIATMTILTGIGTVGCAERSVNADKEENMQTSVTMGTKEYGTTGLDPHKQYEGWYAVRFGICETLFKFTDSLEIEPWLAESYKYLDETHVEIKLRENVKFSNGKKMDSAAVKACFDEMLEKQERAKGDTKIKEIKTDGDYKIIIETSEPTPMLINYLSDPYGSIIDVSEPSTENGIRIGTGPYIVKKYTDSEIHLEKNENYRNNNIKINNFTVKKFNDGTSLTNALEAGTIDVATGLPYSSYELFDGKENYNILTTETTRQFYMKMNFNKEIIQDDTVRKAIAMGVDKEGFVESLLLGHGEVSKGPFPKRLSYGDDNVTTPTYDPEAAKNLLEEAGWTDINGDGVREKDGKELKLKLLTYPMRTELPLLAESAQATLKDIGINIDINSTENYSEIRKSGDYDILLYSAVTAPTGDSDYFFRANSITGASDNLEGYSNPKIDRLQKELHTEFDEKKRKDITVEMTQTVMDDNAYVFVSHIELGVIAKKGIKGIAPHPCDYYYINEGFEYMK